ncbi:hypothetical protein NDU88_006562 [Pleurodeles waltl]|uniref:Uncharacterized protein n=1 Tax=Pleurodeles waltl TaxID=8319 RepID=A0AAV7MMP2_PLEWA|nr:hypothetical protein NDU88_006562 [Pleurodeles waltl]
MMNRHISLSCNNDSVAEETMCRCTAILPYYMPPRRSIGTAVPEAGTGERTDAQGDGTGDDGAKEIEGVTGGTDAVGSGRGADKAEEVNGVAVTEVVTAANVVA